MSEFTGETSESESALTPQQQYGARNFLYLLFFTLLSTLYTLIFYLSPFICIYIMMFFSGHCSLNHVHYHDDNNNNNNSNIRQCGGQPM